MRKISVNLDDLGAESLNNIMNINDCSISDAVNMALLVFAKENTEPVMMADDSPLGKITKLIREKMHMNLVQYCELRHLNISRLRYLVKSCDSGSTVWGAGNSLRGNKWRDNQRGVTFKTHTAWIAHCLLSDLGIDIT